jgi:hypothetical protein
MHIVLSQSFNPGDFDPGRTYPHIKVVRSVIQSVPVWESTVAPPAPDEEIFYIYCQHGEQSGSWQGAISSVPSNLYTISGSDYATIVSGSASAGETGYQAVARLIYDWLLDTNKYQGFLTGTL